LGPLELNSLGMGGVADPKIHAPLRHVKFGSYTTKGIRIKGVRINRKKLPKLGNAGIQPLQMGAWLTPKNKPLLRVSNLVVLRQREYA